MIQDKPTNSFTQGRSRQGRHVNLETHPNVQAQHRTGTVLENGCQPENRHGNARQCPARQGQALRPRAGSPSGGLEATMGMEGTENCWCPNFLKVEGLPGVSLCPPSPLASEEEGQGPAQHQSARPRALLQLSCPGPPPLGTMLLLALSCGHL